MTEKEERKLYGGWPRNDPQAHRMTAGILQVIGEFCDQEGDVPLISIQCALRDALFSLEKVCINAGQISQLPRPGAPEAPESPAAAAP
jgi:hypothetical protein